MARGWKDEIAEKRMGAQFLCGTPTLINLIMEYEVK